MLTHDRHTPRKAGQQIAVPVAAGAIIYAGALVVANAHGYAAGGSEATGLSYLGRAEERVDNRTGGDGDKAVLVGRREAFAFQNSPADPVTQASVGTPCYIVDDETVAATDGTGARSQAGMVLGIDPAGVWVE